MEALIHELNSRTNQGSSARIKDLQRQIQRLQRDRSAWQTGLDFLGNLDANVRFYGALTLTIKINADWTNDGVDGDEGMKLYLLEVLVSGYVRLAVANDASYVLQKVCSTLVALYQRIAATWTDPVRHVLASLFSQQFIPYDQIPAIDDLFSTTQQAAAHLMSAGVRFATTLAEDAADRTGKASGEINQRLSRSCLGTFKLFNVVLRTVSEDLTTPELQTSAGRHEIYLNIAEMVLQGVQPWHSLLGAQAATAPSSEAKASSEQVSLILASTIDLYRYDSLRPYVLQTLISIQQSSPRLILKADNRFPQSFLTSPSVQQTFQSLKEGYFDHEGTLAVELLDAIMSQVDSTSSAYLVSDKHKEALRLLQLLLRCDGVAAVEDTVCQVVLETINQLVDGYTDWSEDAKSAKFSEYVSQACEACFAKATMPIEEMSSSTRTWDTDDKSRFSNFRYDVQDFLLAAYSILGPSLLKAIVGILSEETQTPNWPAYEVSIYCLKAFADTMSDDPGEFATYIEAVLGSSYFQAVLQSTGVPDQARKTSIRFIADITSFLKKHPALMDILNFLFSSLHLPASANSSSQAIYTLCYDQRGSLIGALDGFVASLGMVQDIEGMDRHRIYGGVSAIVQALPTEQDKVRPLQHIVQLLQSAADQITAEPAEEIALATRSTDVLQSMAAVGGGLRTPNDVPIENDLNELVEPTFWTSGAGVQVQQQVLKLYEQVAALTERLNDSAVIEAACDFLRSGLTEDHPSPFKFAANVSTQLISQQIRLESANIDVVLACASCLLASTSRDEILPHLSTLLSPILNTIQQLLSEGDRSSVLGDSSFPSASLDFTVRMLPKWTDYLLSLDGGQQAVSLLIDLALVIINNPDTLPRRSAAGFFSALVDVSKPQKSLSNVSRSTLDGILRRHSPRIIASIFRLVGGECARSELESLSDPIKRYVQHQPMLFKNIAKEVMEIENGLLSDQALKTTTLEQRNRFIAQIDALRGQRKTNDVVKEFWILCRGAGFDYIA